MEGRGLERFLWFWSSCFVARKSVTVDAKRFRYAEVLSQPEVYELPDGYIRSANGLQC